MGEGLANRVGAQQSWLAATPAVSVPALLKALSKRARTAWGVVAAPTFLAFPSLPAISVRARKDSPASAPTRKVSLRRVERNQPRLGPEVERAATTLLRNSGLATL